MDRDTVVRGTSVVSVISAMPGGNAERLLRRIGATNNLLRNARVFPPWKNGTCSGEVRSVICAEPITVTLKLGVQEGLFLEDTPGREASLKAIHGPTIRVGARLSDRCLEQFANQLVACWLVHGKSWMNRKGDVCSEPYGPAPKMRTASSEKILERRMRRRSSTFVRYEEPTYNC